MKENIVNNKNIPNNLYVLKHKDYDVAMVQVNLNSGEIEYPSTLKELRPA